MSKVAKTISEEEEKRRLDVYAKGMTDTESAKELGLTKDAYYWWRVSRNLAPNHPSKSAKHASICWNCKNTNRFKCTWFDPDNPQPVEGWKAEKETLTLVSGVRKDGTRLIYVTDTYRVKECPNFDKEE